MKLSFLSFKKIQNILLLPEIGQFLKDSGGELFKDRYSLYQYLNEIIIKEKPISYLEFGVYKGDSIKKER